MKIQECCGEGGLQSAGFSNGRTGQGQLEGLGGQEGGPEEGGQVAEGLGEGVSGLAMEERQGQPGGFRFNNYKITLTILCQKCYRLVLY